MENAFEDVKREYVNRYSETHGILLADSYDKFVAKMLTAIMTAINGDPEMLRILDKEMTAAIEDGKTPEEWSQEKQKLLIALFFMALGECPQLKHEFAHHLYNELRKENSHE